MALGDCQSSKRHFVRNLKLLRTYALSVCLSILCTSTLGSKQARFSWKQAREYAAPRMNSSFVQIWEKGSASSRRSTPSSSLRLNNHPCVHMLNTLKRWSWGIQRVSAEGCERWGSDLLRDGLVANMACGLNIAPHVLGHGICPANTPF